MATLIFMSRWTGFTRFFRIAKIYPVNPEKSCKSCLIYLSILDPLLAFKTKPQLFQSITCNHPRHVLTHDRSMLESMPRSTTNDPNILKLRMPVDQKITIRRVLILANTRLQHRRIRHSRHSFCQILTHRFQPLDTDHSLTTIGIEFRPVRIDRDLEPTPIDIR